MTTQTHWLLAGAALAMVSCTTNKQYTSLEIIKLVPPTSSDAADAGGAAATCSYSSATQEFTNQVFNDARDFYVGVVVTNNLTNNANTALGRLNTNDFIATQAVTTYEPTDGTSVSIEQQLTPTQGTIPAGTTAVIATVLIPAAVAAKLASAGVTSVRLHTHIEGKLLDGSTITTDEYMPVAVPTASDQDTSSCEFSG